MLLNRFHGGKEHIEMSVYMFYVGI